MNYKTKKKLSFYAVFAIIFGVIGVICFLCNLVNFLKTVTYYTSQGYPLSEVLNEMIFSSIYQILQPLEMFGGVSLLLFALNTVIERLPYNKCEANIIQSFSQPIPAAGETAETTHAEETAENTESTETQKM